MSIQRELSNQEELVHQLDPEPVFDYLLQHRALDQSDVELIRGEEKLADRNVKLLQHLEELGNPAVELFINALRQSGQLHLASLLDVEHRIKPVYGQGYWEKQRYKGQIAISFQLVAAKVMVKKDSEEDRSPKIVDINAMLTPFKVKHSYENMTLIDEDENGPRARKILEYSYEEEDDDKRSCCWCCIPFFCCSSKPRSKSKPDIDKSANVIYSPPTNGAQRNRQNSASSLELYDIMVALPSQPSSPIKSGSTFFKTKKLSPSVESPSDIDSPTFVPKSDNVDRNSNHQLNDVLNNKLPFTETGSDVTGDVNEGDVSFKSTKSDRVDKSKKKNSNKTKNKSDSMLEIKNQKNGHLVGGDNVQKSEDKENSDPLILALNENGNSEVKDKKMKNGKKSPPKSLKTQTSTGMTRSETYELVERWKSEGRAYQTARDQFFSFFDNSVQGRIVRYFEQERSTLVLQISVDDKMAVCTICMTTREVRKLREDYEKGTLHEELVKVVDPQDVVDKMECCAIHLRTVINDEDFTQSYQELS